ncbi:hypothetical protein [Marinobacter adhaerens]|uniref:hypothetical protein n=1 Tax=Marinobacter adhaerens TaxID=1033846 RepID=UPI003F6F25B8
MSDSLRKFTSIYGDTFEISRASLDHIIRGDFSIRPTRRGDKSTQTVLKGGLHTYDGWVSFKKLHADELAHVLFFDSRVHSNWYFARTLGNGVITLRIPKELFSSKASKNTMYPDEYYKSGYLWKTLFPEGYGENDILNAIDVALNNLDRKSSIQGQLVGYCNLGDPLKEIRLVIQHRGEKILSAFPSWSQPNTGNDGKPYSHFDSIGFVVASSTEFFDDKVLLESEPIFCFGGEVFGIERFVEKTPAIFKNRSIPRGNVSAWSSDRERELRAYAESATKSELNQIKSYLSDVALIKNYPRILSGAYAEDLEFRNSKDRYNSVIAHQNIIDGLSILFFSGDSFSDDLEELIIFLLDNMVTFALVDLVIKRKILSTMIEIVSAMNRVSLSERFVLALAKSPVRRELYIEYLPDTIARKRLSTPCSLNHDALMLVSNPNLSIEFKVQDYLEILKEHVGETYAFNFDDEFLNRHLYGVLEAQEGCYIELVSDSLKYLKVGDLTSMSFYFEKILQGLVGNGLKSDLSDALRVILRDYCRIQFAKRLRVNGLYGKFNDYVGEVYEPVDHNLLYANILKHERWFNSFVVGHFLDSIEKYAKAVGDKELENDADVFRAKIGREIPPLPVVKSLNDSFQRGV